MDLLIWFPCLHWWNVGVLSNYMRCAVNPLLCQGVIDRELSWQVTEGGDAGQGYRRRPPQNCHNHRIWRRSISKQANFISSNLHISGKTVWLPLVASVGKKRNVTSILKCKRGLYFGAFGSIFVLCHSVTFSYTIFRIEREIVMVWVRINAILLLVQYCLSFCIWYEFH